MLVTIFYIILPLFKPTDNPFIESFNGSFRDGCLSTNWFLSLQEAEGKIESYIKEYNEFRPHSSLQGRTPQEVENEYILEMKKADFSKYTFLLT